MAKSKGVNATITESCNRRKVSGVSGTLIDLLLPFLIGFLQKCLEARLNPTPQPVTSKASPEAWKTADETKAFALAKIKSGSPTADVVVYKRTASNAAIRRIQREKRKNHEPMSREEAEQYVLAHLDASRLCSLEEAALKIDAVVPPA